MSTDVVCEQDNSQTCERTLSVSRISHRHVNGRRPNMLWQWRSLL